MFDGVVCKVGGEVVTGLADPWKHRTSIAKEIGRPLIGLAAHEPGEILEAHADRPLVERTRDAVLIGWSVVIFAKPRGGITIVPQDRADGRVIRSDDGVIAGITRG